MPVTFGDIVHIEGAKYSILSGDRTHDNFGKNTATVKDQYLQPMSMEYIKT